MNHSEEIKNIIINSNKIAIFPTARLDLDCVSSAILMLEVCKILNPTSTVEIWSDFEIDDYHSNISNGYLFNKIDRQHNEFTKYDLGIIVDGSSSNQLLKGNLGKIQLVLPFKLILIDHHSENNISNESIAKIINSKAKSTTEVIWEELIKPNNINSAKMATLALCGYLGDTQMLRWEERNDNLKFFNELIKEGADFNAINKYYYNFLKFNNLVTCYKLLSENTKEIIDGYFFVSIPLSFEKENKLNPDEFSNVKDYLITQLQNIIGWKLLVILKEAPNEYVWVSLRSTEESRVDCSEICRQLALNGRGGGHERAGGANFKMTFEDAVSHTKELIDNYLNNKVN